MGALEDLQGAAGRLETASIELDNALLAISYRPIECFALGSLSADAVSCARYQLPHAVADAMAATAREVAAIPPVAVPNFYSEDGKLDEVAWAEYTSNIDFDAVRQSLERVKEEMNASMGPNARLLLAFQTAYFIIRALQDAIYRISLELLQNQFVIKGSMEKANNPGNPVRQLMGDFAEEYLNWFNGWRNLRNSIKQGRQAGLAGPPPTGPGDDYGINFAYVDDARNVTIDCSLATRVSGVTNALNATTRLVEIVTEFVKTKADQGSRTE